MDLLLVRISPLYTQTSATIKPFTSRSIWSKLIMLLNISIKSEFLNIKTNKHEDSPPEKNTRVKKSACYLREYIM